jgi:uncharacterized protein YecE (DUF72 family)
LSCVRVGTAGWAIPRLDAAKFPTAGSRLHRYASVFSAVEINSSFRRDHRPATYARWAESTPPEFRFSLKLPKAITHDRRLLDAKEPLTNFLAGAQALGSKLGPILVQLPPSLALDVAVADSFFATLRDQHPGAVVCEPRHESWVGETAEGLFLRWRIGRVAADPPPAPAAAQPAGWPNPIYYRLHGSPRRYYSGYGDEGIAQVAATILAGNGEVWCTFDNTAHGRATPDALNLLARLKLEPYLKSVPSRR